MGGDGGAGLRIYCLERTARFLSHLRAFQRDRIGTRRSSAGWAAIAEHVLGATAGNGAMAAGAVRGQDARVPSELHEATARRGGYFFDPLDPPLGGLAGAFWLVGP